MKRTAIYMRVSTDKQVEKGESIPAQRAALHKYIDDHNDMICVGEYLDDGISGTKENRDELQRMLSDVQAGKIDLIIVTKMDRLHRSLRNFLNMQDLLEKHHCNWLAISEPMYDSTTPQGKMIINTLMNLAEFEAKVTGQRIRQVQAYKVSQGEAISGSTPPGLSIVGKRIVPNQDAPIVREMFQHYARYGNMDKTIRAFDHHGIFPQTKGAYKALLQNTKYIGVFRDNDHFCEPIIDRELFDDVQRKVKINVKASQKETYVFSGLIRCAECGRVLGSNTRRMKNGRVVNLHHYRCMGHYGSVKRCDNAKVMEETVLERYLLERLRPDIGKLVAQVSEAPEKDNSARIAALEKRLARLKELFVNDLISLDEYKQDREKITAEIDVLAAETPRKCVDVTALNDLLAQPFEMLYSTFTADERRFFWRSIIKEIRFGVDRRVDVEYLT